MHGLQRNRPFWARFSVGASPQHFHLPTCPHPQHCMTTLAAEILAGSGCPSRSHAIMRPWSHDTPKYTNRTRGCLSSTVFYVRDAPKNNNKKKINEYWRCLHKRRQNQTTKVSANWQAGLKITSFVDKVVSMISGCCIFYEWTSKIYEH